MADEFTLDEGYSGKYSRSVTVPDIIQNTTPGQISGSNTVANSMFRTMANIDVYGVELVRNVCESWSPDSCGITDMMARQRHTTEHIKTLHYRYTLHPSLTYHAQVNQVRLIRRHAGGEQRGRPEEYENDQDDHLVREHTPNARGVEMFTRSHLRRVNVCCEVYASESYLDPIFIFLHHGVYVCGTARVTGLVSRWGHFVATAFRGGTTVNFEIFQRVIAVLTQQEVFFVFCGIWK